MGLLIVVFFSRENSPPQIKHIAKQGQPAPQRVLRSFGQQDIQLWKSGYENKIHTSVLFMKQLPQRATWTREIICRRLCPNKF
jgi:hypothetical protein